jgi:hypothetical protein
MFAVTIVVTLVPTAICAIAIEFAGVAGTTGDAAAVPVTTLIATVLLTPE